MTIRKEEDGTYTVFYSKRHPITKRPHQLRRIRITSFEKAKQVEKELVITLHDKFKKQITPTWEKAVEEFVPYFRERNVSPKTMNVYYLCLKAHSYEPWGCRFIDEINGSDIRELIIQNLAHRSQSHQKNILKYIRAVFTFAVEKNYISRNPTPTMKFKIGDKLGSVLTEEQARKLLTSARDFYSPWYPIWCMALYTGMRNGELYALTWDKVLLQKRQILVSSSWTQKGGFKDTKSGDDRLVEIAPNLVEILTDLKGNSESEFVLPRLHAWKKGEQARELRKFLMGLDLPVIRFHDLRATWATIMLSKGIEPIKVMIMGGWKDMKTMQRYVRKAGVNIKGITDTLNLSN